MRYRSIVLLAAVSAITTRLGAQNLPSAASPIVCGIDTTARVNSVDTLNLWIPRTGTSRDVAAFREAQARAVFARLDSIPRLGRKDRDVSPYRGMPAGAPELRDAEGLFWFQVRNDGRLAGMHVERPTGWNAVDLAVQRAILRA